MANLKRRGGYRSWQDQVFNVVGLLATLVGIVTLGVLLVDLAIDGLGRIDWQFLTSFPSRFAARAGILSAMDSEPQAAWLVVACDLPNLDNETIRYLLEQRSLTQPFTAYRSSSDSLPEPLCAIYNPSARPIVDEFVAAGIHCPRKIMLRSDTRLLEARNPKALDNINTPDDLSQHAAGLTL